MARFVRGSFNAACWVIGREALDVDVDMDVDAAARLEVADGARLGVYRNSCKSLIEVRGLDIVSPSRFPLLLTVTPRNNVEYA